MMAFLIQKIQITNLFILGIFLIMLTKIRHRMNVRIARMGIIKRGLNKVGMNPIFLKKTKNKPWLR